MLTKTCDLVAKSEPALPLGYLPLRKWISGYGYRRGSVNRGAAIDTEVVVTEVPKQVPLLPFVKVV
ncbi:unnamed protein product [Lathyrus sativus]|nr:unnamed protein product [Lathyrus sativus]